MNSTAPGDRPYKWAQHLAGLDFLEPVPVGRAPGAEAAEGVAKRVDRAGDGVTAPKEGSMAAMASPTNQASVMSKEPSSDPFDGL